MRREGNQITPNSTRGRISDKRRKPSRGEAALEISHRYTREAPDSSHSESERKAIRASNSNAMVQGSFHRRLKKALGTYGRLHGGSDPQKGHLYRRASTRSRRKKNEAGEGIVKGAKKRARIGIWKADGRRLRSRGQLKGRTWNSTAE